MKKFLMIIPLIMVTAGILSGCSLRPTSKTEIKIQELGDDATQLEREVEQDPMQEETSMEEETSIKQKTPITNPTDIDLSGLEKDLGTMKLEDESFQ